VERRALDERFLDEAIEAVHQALARLSEEARLDHAEVRHHLGRLLLDRELFAPGFTRVRPA
jgi:hypothetical protein